MQINDLSEKIIKFRDDRDWKQFHTVKDLIIGLNTECGELSELFLWKSNSEILKIEKGQIQNEIADVFIFLNYLADHFEIDFEKAVLGKIEINERKYPVNKSYGKNTKYTDLE